MEMSLIDRGNYLRSILLLVGKDNIITDREKDKVLQIGSKLGFEKEFIKTAVDELLENEYILKNPPKFSNEEIAKEFIKEGIRLAFVDGQLHFYELQWLFNIAEINGISNMWVNEEVLFYLEENEVDKLEYLDNFAIN